MRQSVADKLRQHSFGLPRTSFPTFSRLLVGIGCLTRRGFRSFKVTIDLQLNTSEFFGLPVYFPSSLGAGCVILFVFVPIKKLRKQLICFYLCSSPRHAAGAGCVYPGFRTGQVVANLYSSSGLPKPLTRRGFRSFTVIIVLQLTEFITAFCRGLAVQFVLFRVIPTPFGGAGCGYKKAAKQFSLFVFNCIH
jgi:hypothetical protein